jgi:cell division protein FtsB
MEQTHVKDDKKTKQQLTNELASLDKENEELKAQAHRYLQIEEERTRPYLIKQKRALPLA